MKSRLMSIYRLEPDGNLDYQIIVTPTDSLSRTGGTADTIPPVKDYRIMSVQKAKLIRQKK
jgi:hypothetical protein